MSAVHVHLAEVPTDVLVHLAAHSTRTFTVHDLASVLAPEPGPDADQAVGRALALLREADYVYRNGAHSWGVTTAGLLAVREATLTGGSAPNPPSSADESAASDGEVYRTPCGRCGSLEHNAQEHGRVFDA